MLMTLNIVEYSETVEKHRLGKPRSAQRAPSISSPPHFRSSSPHLYDREERRDAYGREEQLVDGQRCNRRCGASKCGHRQHTRQQVVPVACTVWGGGGRVCECGVKFEDVDLVSKAMKRKDEGAPGGTQMSWREDV
eukprot:366110-Chlamydomonas_euryale.AAC.9